MKCKNEISHLICILLWLVISGCSSSTLKTSDKIAKSGIEYSDSILKMTDISISEILDSNNETLVENRNKRWSNDSAKSLKDKLNDQNKAMSKTISSLYEWKSVSNSLKNYFQLLEKASTDSVNDKESTENSINNLVQQVNSYYDSRGKEEKISEERKGYINSIAVAAKKAYRAKEIKKSIYEASIPVSKLLEWNHTLLSLMEISLSKISRDRNSDIEKEIRKKFVAGKLDDKWSKKRKDWFLSSTQNTELQKAIGQSNRLKKSWKEIVKGKNNLENVSDNLKDLNAILKTIIDYRNYKPKEEVKNDG